MPLNKNSTYRYQIINGLLKSNEKRKASEIMKIVNERLYQDGFKEVTKRTIYNDFNSMQELYGVSIINEGGFIYYENRSDSINGFSLDSRQKSILEMALQSFRVYEGSTFFEKFSDVITRLLSGSLLRKLEGNENSDIIQISEVNETSGHQWLEPLYEAAVEQKAVNIRYTSFGNLPKERTISPYILKEYQNSWYMIGFLHEKGEHGSIRTFKLNRIDALKPSITPYYKDPAFSKEDYFKYSLGVFSSNLSEPIFVILRFSKEISPLIREEPIHKTMKIIEDNEAGLLVSIEVYDTIELKNKILGYGEDVVVESPDYLRKDTYKTLTKALNNYIVN